MNTMTRIALGTVALLAPLLALAPADAAQPPTKCRVVSVTSETSPDLAHGAWRIDTTTVSRCRGHLVTTVATTYRSLFS